MITTKRPRGTGSLYKKVGNRFWQIKFHDHGIPRRESTGTEDLKMAERYLRRRLAEVETKTYTPPERVLVDDLVALVWADYLEQGSKSLDHTKKRWENHLRSFFERRQADEVTTELVRRYTQQRANQGAKPATINRELSILKRAFKLGQQATPPKVRTIPYIPMFAERNVRKGFLRDDQYDRLAQECAKEGLWLRALLAVAYNYGWRKGELVNLRVGQVDLPSRTIRLEVGETKNSQGRQVKMTGEVFTLLQALVTGKREDDYVFTREDGRRVKDFRSKAWRQACQRAGVLKLVPHDLRRTGARNLRRLGVGETTIMKIGGWKTASVFRRYDIVDEADLAEAANLLDEKRQRLGHPLGTVAPEEGQLTDLEASPTKRLN